MMPWNKNQSNKKEDLVGKVFGMLTVIASASNDKNLFQGRTAWKVRCECGEEFNCVSRYLKRGSATSCGSRKCKYAWPKHKNHPCNQAREVEGT